MSCASPSNALRLSIAAFALAAAGGALAYDDAGRYPTQPTGSQASPPAQSAASAPEARCATKRVQARNASGALVWKQSRSCR